MSYYSRETYYVDKHNFKIITNNAWVRGSNNNQITLQFPLSSSANRHELGGESDSQYALNLKNALSSFYINFEASGHVFFKTALESPNNTEGAAKNVKILHDSAGRYMQVSPMYNTTVGPARAERDIGTLNHPVEVRLLSQESEPRSAGSTSLLSLHIANVAAEHGDLRLIDGIYPGDIDMENPFTGSYFYDHTFKCDHAISKKELDSHDISTRPYYYDIQPEYSFLSPAYEEQISAEWPPESLLPTVYAFLAEQHSDFEDQDQSIYGEFIKLNGAIRDVSVDIKRNKKKVGERDEGDYFKKYSAAVEMVRSLPHHAPTKLDLMKLASRYRNTVFCEDSFELFKESHDKRNVFPMYISIKFNTSVRAGIIDEFAALGISDIILGSMANWNLDYAPLEKEMVAAKRVLTDRYNPAHDYGYAVEGSVGVKVWDVPLDPTLFRETFLEQASNLRRGRYQTASAYLENTRDMAIKYPLPDHGEVADNELLQQITSLVAVAKIRERYVANKRSFWDIIDNDPAYTEVLGYKIEKYATIPDEEGRTLLSTVTIPNSSKLDLVEYVDTQVKYNKEYYYKISQFVMVFGDLIQLDRPVAQKQGSHAGPWAVQPVTNTAATNVITNPSIKIYEVPYAGNGYQDTPVRVIDDPPIAPEVNFVPYKGIENKLLVNINNAFGEYWDFPVVLEDGDALVLEQIWENQSAYRFTENPQAPITQKRIRFSGDDRAVEFEIYRIDFQPFSYEDFQGSQIAGSPRLTAYNGNKYDSASLVLQVQPNKKYYYIFRTIDYHGKFSNPTPVYEVEIESREGIITPRVRPVPFADRGVAKKISRTMRRYIQVAPSFENLLLPPAVQQTLNNANNASAVEFPQVGLGVPSVWGRLFKVRLTSRSTGKKFDLNVSLNLNTKDDL